MAIVEWYDCRGCGGHIEGRSRAGYCPVCHEDRDVFIAAAMTGILSSQDYQPEDDAMFTAKECVRAADMVMEARK